MMVVHVYFTLVPTPIVTLSALNNQQVGDPLLLECNVTTVRGITSSVDIVWSTNNTVVRRFIDTLGEATNNLKVYKDQYTIPGFLVKNNSVYHCQVIIYAKQLASAGAFMRISKHATVNIFFYIHLCYLCRFESFSKYTLHFFFKCQFFY